MAYNLLKGKKGIIFGALNEQSIAWKVAQRAVEEGAEIVLSNAPIALRMGELNKLAEECNAPIIGADVTSNEDLTNLFTQTQEHWRVLRFCVVNCMIPLITAGKTNWNLTASRFAHNIRNSHYSFLALMQKEIGSILAFWVLSLTSPTASIVSLSFCSTICSTTNPAFAKALIYVDIFRLHNIISLPSTGMLKYDSSK